MRLLPAQQVDECFHEPFILRGYRDPAASWRAHVCSLCSLHNETGNVWTHLLACCGFTAFLLHAAATRYSLLYAEHQPMLLLLAGFCTFTLASSTAHLLSGKSKPVRHLCFFLDYSAIFFHAWTSALAYSAYSPVFDRVHRPLYLAGMFTASLLCCLLACVSRFGKHETSLKSLRLVALATPYILSHVPFAMAGLDGRSPDVSLHLVETGITGAAVFLYGSHVPERLFPGRLDLLGHSHQLFHMLVNLASVVQIRAVTRDFQHTQRCQLVGLDYVAVTLFFLLSLLAVVLACAAKVHRDAHKSKVP